DDIGRQRAQRAVMRAINQDALFQAIQYDLLAGKLQLHADHQAHAADFLDKRVAPGKLREPHPEIAADPGDVRQKPVEDIEKLQADAADQGASPESGPVLARAEPGGGALI